VITIKSDREIEIMRVAGRILADVFRAVEPLMKPGAQAKEVDRTVEEQILSAGATPAFKNYPNHEGGEPFPSSVCMSVDAEVVHGFPGNRILEAGTIVGLDIGVKYRGYFADAARTYAIGKIDPERHKLMDITQHALEIAIAEARAGNRLSNIGHAVQVFVESHGCSVVRDLVGHGIGKDLHEDPQIPNYGEPNRGPIIRKNMTFAIEPMINLGTWEVEMIGAWQILTKDRKPSAHFEHTVVITDGEAEILTR
jgi:methionyl aminopeptidase